MACGGAAFNAFTLPVVTMRASLAENWSASCLLSRADRVTDAPTSASASPDAARRDLDTIGHCSALRALSAQHLLSPYRGRASADPASAAPAVPRAAGTAPAGAGRALHRAPRCRAAPPPRSVRHDREALSAVRES